MKSQSLVLVLAAIVVSSSFAQESRPATESRAESGTVTWDLRPSGSARNLVVDLTITARGKITVKKAGTEILQTVDHKSRFKWVDELAALDTKPVVDRRTFLEAQKTEGGVNQDPGLDGMTLVITTEGGDAKLRSEGTRRALTEDLRKQLRQAGATGLFLRGRKDVAIGGSYPFESAAFLITLLDLDGKVSDVKGELSLVRVDGATSRATVSGTVGFREEMEKNGIRFAAAYRGTLALDLDIAGGDVQKAVFIGRAAVSGLGELDGALSGEVDVDAKATATRATDIKALKAKKPAFRENTHRFAGMEIKLPSCWIKLASDKPGIQSFLDSRVEPDLVIELARVAERVDPSSEEFIKSLTGNVRAEDPKGKVVKTSYPIGKGCAFELEKEDRTAVRGAMLPLGDEIARVRVVGPLDLVKKADSEFRSALNSVKKAKP